MYRKDKGEDDRMDDGDKREKCGIEKSYGWWEYICKRHDNDVVWIIVGCSIENYLEDY